MFYALPDGKIENHIQRRTTLAPPLPQTLLSLPELLSHPALLYLRVLSITHAGNLNLIVRSNDLYALYYLTLTPYEAFGQVLNDYPSYPLRYQHHKELVRLCQKRNRWTSLRCPFHVPLFLPYHPHVSHTLASSERPNKIHVQTWYKICNTYLCKGLGSEIPPRIPGIRYRCRWNTVTEVTGEQSCCILTGQERTGEDRRG